MKAKSDHQEVSVPYGGPWRVKRKSDALWWIALLVLVLSGCAFSRSELERVEGVRRISPRGDDWSYVSGIGWSPDGTTLAVSRSIGGPHSVPQGYIYLVGADGTAPSILEHTQGEWVIGDPAWSQSTNRIAFPAGNSKTGIWLADANDQENPHFLREGYWCAWSPDGDQIAVASPISSIGHEYTISIVELATGDQSYVFRAFEEGNYVNGEDISWSPDGDRLAFSLGFFQDVKAMTSDLYELDLATGQSRLLKENGRDPSWSPDGKMIAFISTENWEHWAITILRLDDETTVEILGDFDVRSVAWSPDGSELAFTSEGKVYAIETEVALGH